MQGKEFTIYPSHRSVGQRRRHNTMKNLICLLSISKLDWVRESLTVSHTVHSVPVFCDFKSVFLPSPDVSPLILIAIVGSNFPVQHSLMTQWLPDATWASVPNSLADLTYFLQYMSPVENSAEPWFKLSMFDELGLPGIIRHSGPLAVCCQNIHCNVSSLKSCA